ncbi:MAG: hypothetical protein LBR75_04145, partial [Prevotellaceae bacterium]|nr:hypothetical protein [Prevotellaceae bacterium]
MKKFIFLSGFFLAAIGAGAQVTIGSGNPPSEYSLLDIDTSVQKKGFHLPRLTTGERDALTTTEKNLTEGLVIFNTETLCLEYWNQKEWVSLCKTDDPCANLDLTDRTFCSTENKKVSDLGSRIEWYDAATGGSPLAATTALATGSYYAGNCEDGVRQEVKVMLADCSSMPAAGAVTAWTNVMYDFQTQQLEAFGTAAGGGDAVSFKWQVSSTSESAGFTDIAGAPNSAFYTSPENYVHGFSNDGKSQELWFRCERTNPKGTTVTAALKMLNIITTDGNGNFVGGYGEQGGVKYLEIQSLNQHHVANGQKVKIALTNLGATNDNNLGDFYQWGRVADGHQVIGWTKSTGTA